MSGSLTLIRCLTCGKVLADKEKRFSDMLENGESIEVALNKLGLNRPCCRLRMRNPFHYAEKVDSNDDNLYTAKNKNLPVSGALSAISRNTNITIPKQDDIELPPLPDLPPIQVEEKKHTRTYTAW